MLNNQALIESLKDHFKEELIDILLKYDEVSIKISKKSLISVMRQLKTLFKFEQLIDVVGVDYLHFGKDEWKTYNSSSTSVSRGVVQDKSVSFDTDPIDISNNHDRFAVIYHLLSLSSNIRLRVKVYLKGTDLMIPSVVNIWPSANWSEREVFDMFGFIFTEHPDLRRILTDYGFVGHPLRKDFPQSGYVETRYDETQKRVIYEHIEIDPRINAPKVIRKDNRYSNSI